MQAGGGGVRKKVAIKYRAPRANFVKQDPGRARGRTVKQAQKKFQLITYIYWVLCIERYQSQNEIFLFC